MGLNKKTGFILTIIILLFMTNLAFADAPTISNQTPANGAYTNNPKPQISFHAEDLTDGLKLDSNYNPEVLLKVAGETIPIDSTLRSCGQSQGQPCLSADFYYFPVNDLASGSITVEATVWDTLDNPSSATWTFNIDTTAPTITDNDTNDDVWTRYDATITLSPNDTESGIKEVKYCTGSGCTPSTALTSPYVITLNTEQNNPVRYIAIDNANNSSAIGEFIVKIDKTAPTINNKLPSTDTANTAPVISFDVNDSGAGFENLPGNLEMKVESASVSPTVTTIGNNAHITYAMPTNAANRTVTVEVIAKDKLGNTTASQTWNFNIDTVAPANPNAKINSDNSYTNSQSVTMNLDSSISASQCGFRNDSDSTVTFYNYSTSMSWTLANSDGTRTVYAICKDAAGNNSPESSDTIVLDRAAPATPSAPSIAVGNEQVTVSWGTVSDSLSGLKEYKVYKNGSVYTTVSSSTNSQTVTGLTNGTSYSFKVGAVDNAGNEAVSSETSATPQATNSGTSTTTNQNDFDIPVVAWSSPAAGSIVSGIVTLEVTASDNGTGISSILFELPDKNYVGAMVPVSGGKFNGTWQVKWFAWNLENGKEYAIKVRANDSGHPNNSSAWISRTFKVDNSVALSDQQKTEASTEIANAEAKKTIFEDLAESMQANGLVLSEQSVSEKAAADDLLLSAKDQFEKKKYPEARDNAVLAAEKYSGLADSLAVNDYGETQVYSFAMEKAEAILKGIGFTDSSAKEASELMSAFNATRKFSIKEIIDGDSTRYQATVIIALENSGEDREIKIIEIVPKEFAENADLLAAGSEMVVIEADPKIEFDLAIKAGETVQVSYSLKKELTKEEADQLLESKPMDLFIAPPIVLNRETSTGNANAAGFFSLGGIAENAGWIGLIVVVVIIACIGFLSFNRTKEPDSNLSWNGGGKMGFLDNWKKNKKEDKKTGKWGYKGE